MIRLLIGLVLLGGTFEISLFQILNKGNIHMHITIPVVVLPSLFLIISGLRKVWPELHMKEWNKESLIKLLRLCIFDYKKFIHQYLSKPIPHFTFFALLLFGVYVGLNYVFGGFIVPGESAFFDSWVYIWLTAILLGLVLAWPSYYLGGFFYQLLVSISGGKWNPLESRRTALYSFLPIYAVGIISIIFYSLVYWYNLPNDRINPYVALLWLVIIFIVNVISFCRSHFAVKNELGAKPVRSFIFFLFIPIILSFVSMAGVSMYAFRLTDNVVLTEDAKDQRLLIARTSLKQHDHETAKDIFIDMVEGDNKSSDYESLMNAYVQLASIYYFQDDIENALKYAEMGIDDAKMDSGPYYRLKSLKAMAENDNEAMIEAFKGVLTVSPNDSVANSGLGQYYLQVEDFNEALPYNEKAFQINPTIRNKEFLAMNYNMIGRRDEAKAYFEEILKVDPKNVLALYHLVSFYMDSGDTEMVILYINKLKTISPELLTPEMEAVIVGE